MDKIEWHEIMERSAAVGAVIGDLTMTAARYLLVAAASATVVLGGVAVGMVVGAFRALPRVLAVLRAFLAAVFGHNDDAGDDGCDSGWGDRGEFRRAG